MALPWLAWSCVATRFLAVGRVALLPRKSGWLLPVVVVGLLVTGCEPFEVSPSGEARVHTVVMPSQRTPAPTVAVEPRLTVETTIEPTAIPARTRTRIRLPTRTPTPTPLPCPTWEQTEYMRQYQVLLTIGIGNSKEMDRLVELWGIRPSQAVIDPLVDRIAEGRLINEQIIGLEVPTGTHELHRYVVEAAVLQNELFHLMERLIQIPAGEMLDDSTFELIEQMTVKTLETGWAQEDVSTFLKNSCL